MTTSNVSSGQSLPGLIANSGDFINVLSGGTITNASVLAGGSATISVGGLDSGSVISAGGVELVYGSATGDTIAGSQTVSTGTAAGVVTNETVVNGGVVLLAVKTTSAANITLDSGGTLNINGAISASNITLSGGTVDLESAKAELIGTLVFAGGGELLVTGNTSAGGGTGDEAVITGFGAGAVIDMTAATTLGAATSATLTTATSGGNTIATVSGGGVSDSYIFSGTSIAANLALSGDGAGGREIIFSATAPVTSVGNGASASDVTVSRGAPLTVYGGGTVVNTTILSGGSATVLAGGFDSAGTISFGGSETLLGSASGDLVYGIQTLGAGTALASNEVVETGGSVDLTAAGATISGATVSSGAVLTLNGGSIAINTTVVGGTVVLQGTTDTLSGSFVFNGGGTLDLDAVATQGAGDRAVISGFYAGDVINISAISVGATLTTTVSGGNTVATVNSGGVSETLTFSGTAPSNLSLTSSGGIAQLDYAGPPTTSSYTPGDLVLSIYGDGSGTGSYTLDQAAPITLEEITQSGQIVSDQELPQTTTLVSGTTEYAISGEYESASEGVLSLAGNGQSLVIAGYGVTATNFDAANAASIYGTTALGQTTSILGGQYTAVERVVADISYNGSVDTSTSLNDVFNTNNPRSVYTVNGTVFYLGGQGNGADGTEGVFVANDGASSATPIYNTETDARDVEVYNGQLYVSVDSKLNAGAGLYEFGATLPTGQTAPIELPGIGESITLTAAQANSVNASAIGESVNLSPEQYFFAAPSTLYIADGGDPKEGGLGDGGLQKWSLVNGTWVLDYTLSTGINQVADTVSTGTTGLVGLTGTVEGGNVVLYATNQTAAETDQTYLYTITDALAATTAPSNEGFTLLDTAAPDTLIRGVAFAPTASSTTPVVSTGLTVSSGVTSTGLSITTGGTLTVKNGGTIAGTTLLSGGSAFISSGGVDSATFIAHGANELIAGGASFDIVDGVQTVSNATAVVTSEVIENGGTLGLVLAGAIASGTTVNSGGLLYLNGHAFATNTVISGGSVVLESPKATVSGTLNFVGSGGTLAETVVVSAASSGYGDQAVISGFGAGDVIDEQAFAGALTTTVSGGNVIATLTSGTTSEVFTLAGSGGVSGSAYAANLSVQTDAGSGSEIIYTPPPPVDIIVSATKTSTGLSITSGNEITVLSGGTMSSITVYNGGSAVISALGEDLGSTILAGGFETVSGDANGDQIYGTQLVTSGPSGATLPATVENETVYNGGTLELYLKPDVATNITVSSGGSLLLSGNVSAVDTTLEAGAFMALQSPKAVISGGLIFAGAATLDITAVTSSGFGGSAGIISGWGAGDVIDETLTAPGATLSTTTSGGNTIETISGATYPDVFVFSGTSVGAHIALVADGTGGVELAYQAACIAAGTRIMTENGPRPIEHLQIGERVVTATGAHRPVQWLGYRSVDIRRHPRPYDVMPIRVKAGAIAPGCPARDVVLSPDHAVFVDDVLIPVRYLLNGATIVQERAERITWWHVELESHDVILAEGLPTESYLDTGNRGAFVNGGAAVHMHPRFARDAASAWAHQACAALVEDGPILAVVRARLAARATAMGAHASAMTDIVLLGSGRVAAVIPPHIGTFRLISNAMRPSGDHRLLGALITGLRVDGAAIALDDAQLGLGFHALETHGAHNVRWTDGAATVNLAPRDVAQLVEVDVATLIADAAA